MNNTAKHTPGPWVSGEYSSGTEVTGRNGKTICFLAVSRSDQSPAADTSRANATLIAAAPAMYADLCAVRDYLFELYDEGNAKAGEYAASLGITIEQAEGRHHE